MIIAAVSKLTFTVAPKRHTVDYAEKSTNIQFHSWGEQSGNFKLVVVSDMDEAVAKLRAQLRNFLSNCHWKPDPIDFRFQIMYSEVENGEFWFPPAFSNCLEYTL